MNELIDVKVVGEQKIKIKYKDGLEGEVDLKATIKKNSYDELNNPEMFSKVFINKNKDLGWPCGVEMCKDALHKHVALTSLMSRLRIKY